MLTINCDRCAAQINTQATGTPVSVVNVLQLLGTAVEYQLCQSCADSLAIWVKAGIPLNMPPAPVVPLSTTLTPTP